MHRSVKDITAHINYVHHYYRPLRIKSLFELTQPTVKLKHPIAEFTIGI